MHMDAQHLCFGYRCAIAFFHDTRPQPAGRAEFRNFKEKVQTGSKNPADAWRKIIHLLSGLNRSVNVSNRISESKSNFLNLGRAGFPDVIGSDADGIPFGNIFGAIFKGVGNQPHGRTGWEDVRAAGNIFF